jgi:hypothetical protein
VKIHLHIERLVFDGVAVDQPRILREALAQELTGRLKEGGLSPELRLGGAVPHVRGGAIELGQGSHPARLGAQIAGAVYRGIGARK